MNKPIHILCLLLTLPFLADGQNLPREQVFNSNNEVSVGILGKDRNYLFRSNKLSGRFDKNQRHFEFILPIQTLLPIKDSSDINVFNDIFVRNNPSLNIRITAAFQDPLVNIEEFKSPREFILDGWLTMHGVQYNVPVVMSMYYNNEMLFYKLKIDLNLYQLNWHIPPHYRTFLTGIVQIQVNDGRWRNYLTQAK